MCLPAWSTWWSCVVPFNELSPLEWTLCQRCVTRHRCLGLWHPKPVVFLSSSSSSVPISEHSRLHKLTPLWAILRTHPRCVETKVMGLKVEFYCTEPCPPWLTCPASPICWRTIDGCSKDAQVVLWWVSSRKMPEQTSRLFAIIEVTGGWPVLRLIASLAICAVYGICTIRRRHHWSNESRRRLEATVILHMSAP